MFERILVPLDGSERAERAIPVAARIARATSGSMVLLQVVEQATEYDMYPVRATIVTTQEVEVNVTKATDYLTSLMQKDELEGVGIQIEVLIGDVAPTICSFAQSTAADLIVMCSHGYTGFKRWFLGSVANVTARTAPVPVLILRDGGPLPTDMFQEGCPLRVLVTVDGSPLSEAVIEPVAHLAAALASPTQGEVHLLRIVDFPVTYGQGKSQANISMEIIEQAKQTANAYLTSLMEQLVKGSIAPLNLSLSASVIVGNDVASSIIEAAESIEDAFALLALSTHGRSGWKRRVMGSVTQRVLHSTKLPLFIVPPQQRAARKEGNYTQASTGAKAPGDGQSWVGLL
ncbi:MAG TPA: universal stress protein [Ktedonobacteraceae bacterium]|nr:universal stress protein [Ktedonobacteraceae bacterium]